MGKIKSILIFLFAVLALVSCTREPSYRISAEDRTDVKLTIRIPQAKEASRSGGAVGSVDIIAFDCGSGDGAFLYRTSGSNIEQEEDVLTCSVTLYNTEGVDRYDFYVLANSEGILDTHGSFEGETKASVRSSLTLSLTEEELRGIDDNTMPLWGEIKGLDGDDLAGEFRNAEVELMRMLAKINLSVDVDEREVGRFMIKEVYVCNYYKEGYLIPGPELLVSAGDDGYGYAYAYVSGPTLNDGWEAEHNDADGRTNMYAYPSEGGLDMYAFEAPAGSQGKNDSNFGFIIKADWDLSGVENIPEGLEGELGGELFLVDRYYRIDIGLYYGGYIGEYLPLKRNHQYNVTINGVYGLGYDGFSEAYESGSFENSIDVDVEEYNKIIVTGDGYYFSLSQAPLVFHVNRSELQSVRLYARTNSSVGWKTEYMTVETEGYGEVPVWSYDDGYNGADTWIELLGPFSAKSTDGSVNQVEIGFKFAVNDTGQDRVAYLYFSFRNILRKLKIIQKSLHGIDYTRNGEGFMEVARTDYHGNDGDKTFFTTAEISDIISEERGGGSISLEDIREYIKDYHVPFRSELIMMWVYDMAWDDESTGMDYDNPAFEYGYDVSNKTTYWTNTTCAITTHQGRLSWVNMARGRVDCTNVWTDGMVWHKDDAESGGDGIEGRRMRLVRANPDGGKFPFILDFSEVTDQEFRDRHGLNYANATDRSKIDSLRSGLIIVSRINLKGVKHRAILDMDNYADAWDRYENSSANSIAAILQIQNSVPSGSGNWSSAKCGWGSDAAVTAWRMPTQREMQMIYALGGMGDRGNAANHESFYAGDYISFAKLYGFRELREYDSFLPLTGREKDSNAGYWTATSVSDLSTSNSVYKWEVYATGQTGERVAGQNSVKANVRCVRTMRLDEIPMSLLPEYARP